MNNYTNKQIEELLELMPSILTYLRARRDGRDLDAEALFDQLDDYCWHIQACGIGVTCENGKHREAK